MSKKIDLNKKSQEIFKEHPDKVRVFVTTDGQGFFHKNYAINHAAKNKLEYQEFFRQGHEKEDNTDLEELLVTTEEKVLTLEATLEAIQDAANVEAETTPEIPENAHEALKVVGELREKHANVSAELVTANEKADQLPELEGKLKVALENTGETVEVDKQYNALTAKLATLVKGNTTKLGEAIIKLLPVTPEA